MGEMRIDGEVIQDHREIMKQEGHPRVKLGHSTIHSHAMQAFCVFKGHMIDPVDGDINVLT